MTTVRVYVPTTLPELSGQLRVGADGRPDDARAVVAGPGALAFSVTPGLREWYRDGDLEELEYVAFTHAARASLRRLASSTHNGAQRRVVLAVDVADKDAGVAPDIDLCAVRVGAAITLDAVAAVHVDDPSAVTDVEAAARAVVAADAGDDDAQFVVDGLDDHELQWYAVQEIGTLLDQPLS